MPGAVGLKDLCARCGHSFSFHRKAMGKPCRAIGCRKGPDGAPCPGFVRTKPRTLLGRPEFRAPE